jgi:hypothetical protein
VTKQTLEALDAWAAELRQADAAAADAGMTVEEMAEALRHEGGNRGVKFVRRILNRAHIEGRLKMGYRPIMSFDGRQIAKKVYVILPKAKPKR